MSRLNCYRLVGIILLLTLFTFVVDSKRNVINSQQWQEKGRKNLASNFSQWMLNKVTLDYEERRIVQHISWMFDGIVETSFHLRSLSFLFIHLEYGFLIWNKTIMSILHGSFAKFGGHVVHSSNLQSTLILSRHSNLSIKY